MKRQSLEAILQSIGPAALAVSGGIDSLTLATVACGLDKTSTVFHAISPAVPKKATDRVRRLAQQMYWPLVEIDAREFQDSDYRANPVNRCFYCKQNLYGTISAHTEMQILSGTNLDDINDYRPGLRAASQHGVRHPFVEAGLDKNDIRAHAKEIGLGEISTLPASPCLSSRVTTGIRIDPIALGAIDRTEENLRNHFSVETLRCRLSQEGYRIEIDANSLAKLDAAAVVIAAQKALGSEFEQVTVAPYEQGSAFVGSPR